MAAKLLYRAADGRDAAAELSEKSYLGRAVECVVRTDDAMVSRLNCQISHEGGHYYVMDLGSANGTFVTSGVEPERQIARELLRYGDVIRCGSLQVRFICTDELATSSAQPDAHRWSSQPPPAAADPLIGSLIEERYRVLDRIGEGSVGIVYRVEHIHLNKLFALKVMRSSGEALDQQRFEQAAQLASRIRHNNVVRISDFGVLPLSGSQPYLVMELLVGHTLGEALREGCIDLLLACHIAVQITRGLQAVHRQNIIHRNLKPDAIFLVDPGEMAAPEASVEDPEDVHFVKILDFGIAKSLDKPLNGERIVVGTPGYMSPELFTSSGVDWRTDQYSLGCILYKCITGELPFTADTPIEVISKHVKEQPIPPRQRRLKLEAEVPALLEQIVMRTLEKRPRDRYPSMRALEHDLRKAIKELRRREPPPERSLVAPARQATEPASPPAMFAPRTAPELVLGQRLGPYIIERLIARGGMSRVYEATNPELRLRVAIKLLGVDGEHMGWAVQRMLAEARIGNRVRDEGVLHIFELGWLTHEVPYLVMEFLEGEELGERLRRLGRVPVEQAVRWGRQIAAVMTKVHDYGVIHRDLKPTNIFLIPDAELADGERIKILDFGIARHLADDQRLTSFGVLMGTPNYMAPEQASDASSVSPAADVYSLGVMLYQMLAGRLPFENLFARQNHALPPLPSDVPRPLVELVLSMLSLHPAQRPSMAACRTAFAAIVVGKQGRRPVARPPGGSDPDLGVYGRIVRTIGRIKQIGGGPAGKVDGAGGWQALSSCLPASMAGDREAIEAFLRGAFGGCERVADGVVRLCEPRAFEMQRYSFFAIFPAESGHGPAPVLRTRAFVQQTHLLEEYLRQLDKGGPKVILAITESMELGRGIREKIFEYRQQYEALVLPLYIGELRKVGRGGAHELLFDRLKELHDTPDLFASAGPLSDPMQFFGMRETLNEIVYGFGQGVRVVLLCGIPGAGKSSLVNMVEYSLSSRRFVRLKCGADAAVSTLSAVSAQAARLLEASESRAAGTEKAGAGGGQPTLMVLEDFDQVLASEPDHEQMLAFLQTLVDWIREHDLAVLITGMRAFELGRPVLFRRKNPLYPNVRTVQVAGLSMRAAGRLLGDLGLQMNIRFDHAATRLAQRWSDGHVSLLRLIGSTVVSDFRRTGENHPLAGFRVQRSHVQGAVRELSSRYETFGDVLWQTIGDSEARALRMIAFSNPRERRAALYLRNQCGSTQESSQLMDLLRQMGLIRRARGRVHLRVPLLEEWIRYNQDPLTDGQSERSWLPLSLIAAAGVWLGLCVLLSLLWDGCIADPLLRYTVWLLPAAGLFLAAGCFHLVSPRWIGERRAESRETAEPQAQAAATLPPAPIRPLRIFFSYSHADQKHASELEKHLSLLKREGIADVWHYQRLMAGEEWQVKIDKEIDSADIIILMVSPDFMNSDYCFQEELMKAREKHLSGRACIIPVVVRPVPWQSTWIGSLQALPQDGKPVTKWEDADDAWNDVAQGIRRIAIKFVR
jgi:serine/threonine protein kinase